MIIFVFFGAKNCNYASWASNSSGGGSVGSITNIVTYLHSKWCTPQWNAYFRLMRLRFFLFLVSVCIAKLTLLILCASNSYNSFFFALKFLLFNHSCNLRWYIHTIVWYKRQFHVFMPNLFFFSFRARIAWTISGFSRLNKLTRFLTISC